MASGWRGQRGWRLPNDRAAAVIRLAARRCRRWCDLSVAPAVPRAPRSAHRSRSPRGSRTPQPTGTQRGLRPPLRRFGPLESLDEWMLCLTVSDQLVEQVRWKLQQVNVKRAGRCRSRHFGRVETPFCSVPERVATPDLRRSTRRTAVGGPSAISVYGAKRARREHLGDYSISTTTAS